MAEPGRFKERALRALRSERRLGSHFKPAVLRLEPDDALLVEGEVETLAQKRLALERLAALPEATDVIDKSFLKGSAIFSSRARITAWRRAGSEVKALPRSLYRRASFAASVRAFFGPRGFQPATKRA